MIKKIVFALCVLCVGVLNAQETLKIYKSKIIQNNAEIFFKIVEKSHDDYYKKLKKNDNNFRKEVDVFNLFNVVDPSDSIEQGLFDDLVLKKGIYAFSITDRLDETFLFVSDDFFTFSTGYWNRYGESAYHYFNLEEQLENFIQSNPDFIKSEAKKRKIIHRLKYENYRRITSLR